MKPIFPVGMRWFLRRIYAKGILERSSDIWPIDRAAGTQPEGWSGWPQRKKFCLVLTHDVETEEGLANVRPLAEMEMEMGLRSSFNFVPQGAYQVTADLRDWLEQRGFEVGVHDLKHDGHLFASRKRFRENARLINHYLKDWNSKGFRTGFMLHELEWMHDLNIQYDASCFDTDPFEPQPDGCMTIFPFLIKGDRDGIPHSYVELPYTLAQDSTLFLLLQEKTIGIWRRKLDWIAAKGGMVLLNTHPDYMEFGKKKRKYAYSARLYKEILQYVISGYRGEYWHALPKEVAAWSARNEVQYDSVDTVEVPRWG